MDQENLPFRTTASGGSSSVWIRRRDQQALVVFSIPQEVDMLEALAQEAKRFNWRLLDLNLLGGVLPVHQVPAGAIMNRFADDPIITYLQKQGCPCVRIGNLPHPLDHRLPAVLPDKTAAGRLAAEHFAERGFRETAYVGYTPLRHGEVMYDAFRKRAEELGCRNHFFSLEKTAKSELDPAKALTGTAQRERDIGDWLRSLPKPVGVLGYNDQMAAKLCLACMRAGLKVPEDVAVLGQKNNRFDCEFGLVPLSSISLNPAGLGRQAALLLQSLMQGKTAPSEPIIIPPRGIVSRQSTDILAVGDPGVARALRYMWDHLESPLNVDFIARKVGVSRRTLERSFQQHLQRGVNAEMRRKRLARARELLSGTAMPISEISVAVGLGSENYLYRIFRQTYGITPRQYRMQVTGQEQKSTESDGIG